MTTDRDQLLLVEHDDSCVKTLLPPLRKSGWWVTRVSSASEAYLKLRNENYGAVMFGRWLPDADGLDFLSYIRERWPTIPAIVLSAQAEPDDRVDVFSAGADYYPCAPYNELEIRARLWSIRQRLAQRPNSISIRDFELYKDTRTVLYSGRPVQLSPTEFDILHCLVSGYPYPVNRKTLLKKVFHLDIEPGTNVVEVHIHRLRRKLVDNKVKQLLKTVSGQGYVLDSEPDIVSHN